MASSKSLLALCVIKALEKEPGHFDMGKKWQESASSRPVIKRINRRDVFKNNSVLPWTTEVICCY